jgi:hypothetical protein
MLAGVTEFSGQISAVCGKGRRVLCVFPTVPKNRPVAVLEACCPSLLAELCGFSEYSELSLFGLAFPPWRPQMKTHPETASALCAKSKSSLSASSQPTSTAADLCARAENFPSEMSPFLRTENKQARL